MKKKIVGIFVCTLMITVVFTTTGTQNNLGATETPMLIRINSRDTNVVLPETAEIIKVLPDKSIDIILSNYDFRELTKSELDYDILIEDMNEYHRSMRGEYHTLAQIENILVDTTSMYPEITSLFSIGTTFEGRDIWCIEITDNPGIDEGEPGVMFIGLYHAREWPTVEICLHVLDELTSGYDQDPEITEIVNNRRLWLITCLNPDGYYYCHDLGNDWRKNRQFFPEFGTYGVDLARNFGGSCDGNPWGAWGSIGYYSGYNPSHNPTSEAYCGPWAFSENETQAIRDLFISFDICAVIDWHTYGEYIVFPWSYTNTKAPDHLSMYQVGNGIASLITTQSGTSTYSAADWTNIAPGTSVDFEYGYSHYILGKASFPYVIEACEEFHPPIQYLDQICAENLDGALYLLQEAQNISTTITPRVIPPVIGDMTTDTDGAYSVTWEEQNPNANPDYFQLDELTNLSINTDDAESGDDLWTLDGFEISTSRAHSSIRSFKSRYSNDDVSSMTSAYPLLVTDGMALSFWCWYDIQKYSDMAFVEVSRDGCYYELIDTFKGSSGNWIYKEYDLSDYSNESIFIRFRYSTDLNYQLEGFYVDDISPVAFYETITTISSSIYDNNYDITGRSNGNYYYRVRGYNSARGWGDFSTLEDIEVIRLLSIQSIKGGLLRVSTSIENIGLDEVTNVSWNITLDGGFILFGKKTTGVIPSIPVDGEVDIASKFIFGLGKIMVTVEAGILDGSSVSRKQSGSILLIRIRINPNS